jgi:hypothetical protein
VHTKHTEHTKHTQRTHPHNARTHTQLIQTTPKAHTKHTTHATHTHIKHTLKAQKAHTKHTKHTQSTHACRVLLCKPHISCVNTCTSYLRFCRVCVVPRRNVTRPIPPPRTRAWAWSQHLPPRSQQKPWPSWFHTIALFLRRYRCDHVSEAVQE